MQHVAPCGAGAAGAPSSVCTHWPCVRTHYSINWSTTKGSFTGFFKPQLFPKKRDRQGAEEVSVGVGSPSFKQTHKVGKHRLLWKHLVKSAIWQWGFQQSVTDKWCPVQDFLTSSLGFVSGRLHTGLPGLLYQTAGRKSRRTSLRSQPAEERPALHHCWFPW